MDGSPSFLGEMFALGSAFLWAVGAILFQRLGRDVSPVGMNLGKSIVALVCLSILCFYVGLEEVNGRTILFLLLSGLLGIALSDTFHFKALMLLGPRQSLVVDTLIPVATIVFALIILNEGLSFFDWIGIGLTLGGVLMVLFERVPKNIRGSDWHKGITFGIATVITCSLGIICSKMVLHSISALQATFIRQIGGVIGLLLWGLKGSQVKTWMTPFKDPILIKRLLVVAFFGTFIGTWFSILGLKYTQASIATTLNATSPIFILPLAFFLLKEKITIRSIAGAVLAVGGIALIFIK